MDLRQLRYFVGIVDAGSMTAAAERMHVAQSALSHHVRSLEERFGVPLLVRESTGVSPTAAGLRLLEHARPILAAVGAAEMEMSSIRADPFGEVTIAIPPGVGRVLNAALLEAARERVPAVGLHLVEAMPDVVQEWITQGSVDLGIVYELDAPDDSVGVLAQEELYLVSGAELPACDHGVTLESLAEIGLVMPICVRDPKHCIATYAQERGIALRVDARVDSLGTILDLVVNRSGAAILSPGAFLGEWQSGRLHAYPLLPPLRRSVLLRASASTGGEPAVRAVQRLVGEVGRSLLARGSWPLTLCEDSRSAA